MSDNRTMLLKVPNYTVDIRSLKKWFKYIY